MFYEAARDLGSQPPPRTDRVEACRPRECLMVNPSVARNPERRTATPSAAPERQARATGDRKRDPATAQQRARDAPR